MDNRRARIRGLLAASLVLVLIVLACGPTGSQVPTATATLYAPQTGNVTITPQATEVSPTPQAPVTTASGCTLDASYVADVTIPDNTPFAPGTAFTKTWRVRNSGTCAWEAGTVLVFSSGERMNGPDSVPAGAAAAGATIDVSVSLVAPGAPGTYRGYWQLQAPDGTRFGSPFYVQIVVPAPVTNTPTPQPGPMCTPPACPPGQIAICPGPCTGGCGMVCVTPTPGACAIPVDPALAPVLTHAQALGYDLGCPTAAATTIFGAFQEFWTNLDNPNPHMHFRSLMVWRSDNQEIYVIDGQDTDASQGMLLAYTDTWNESQPEIPPACASMTPPAGYQLPIRGFGKVWCNNSLVGSVGWPAQAEEGVSLIVQPMQTGLLLKVIRSTGGYLIALDYRAVWGVTIMAP